MDTIIRIIESTARRMDPPKMFGAFHMCAFAAVLIAAVILTKLFMRSEPAGGRHFSTSSDESYLFRRAQTALVISGWILIILEIYKQLFLYYIVNGGAYDWWYFPFQLCSVPMYLCVLLPVFKGRFRQAVLTFLSSYTIVGALAALVYPEDFLRGYLSLTLHGFVWHGMLIFIGLVALMSLGTGTTTYGALKSFAGATALFLVLCAVAVLINIAVEPAMQAGKTLNHYAAMFYLNPYHLSPQIIVGSVQQQIGIPAGLTLYVIVIIITSGIVFRIFESLKSILSRSL